MPKSTIASDCSGLDNVSKKSGCYRSDRERRRAVERLTALWALNETALGGFVHALKIPFTGIAVVSIAVVLISLIAFFSERRSSAILKATVIVLLIKAAVSPHAPVTAHIAVAFQGLAGAALFAFIPLPRVASLALGLLALWEGAAQKLLVLTLLYGKPLWESVDSVGRVLIEGIGASPCLFSPTGWILAAYFSLYTLAGLAAGWLAGALPGEIEMNMSAQKISAVSIIPEPNGQAKSRRIPNYLKVAFMLCLLVMTALILQPGSEGLGRAVWITVRTILVISIWLLVARPLARTVTNWALRRGRNVYGAEAVQAMEELPRLRALAGEAWRKTANSRGLARWKRFLTSLITASLRGQG